MKNEKQAHLIFFEELLRQAEPQLNTLSLENLRDKISSDLSDSALMSGDSHLSLIPIELQEIINSWRTRLQRLKNIVGFIKCTDAAELTKEKIVAIN
ncbi:MAG TPA: hypothetical protein VF690_20590 [Hymenobacter sp.]